MTNEDIEEQVRTQLAAFEEIMSGEDTRPISSMDMAGITGAIRTWRGGGVRISVTAWTWEILPYSSNEKEELLQLAMVGGWVPFYVGDNHTEYRVVKSLRGRGFLGGEKVGYRVYELMSSGRFRFISEHKSINTAAWALNNEFAR